MRDPPKSKIMNWTVVESPEESSQLPYWELCKLQLLLRLKHLEAYLKHVAGLNSPFTFSRSGTSAARLLTIQTRRSGVLTSFISTFPYDLELCPVETLKQYETLTTSLRHRTSTSLFIVLVKPHEPVTFATIAWWLCEVLKLVAMEVSIFQAAQLEG